MPDSYIPLPDGRYVRIPPDATPTQLDTLRARLRPFAQDPLTRQTQVVAPETTTKPFFERTSAGSFPSTNPIEKAGQRLDLLGQRESRAMRSPTPVSDAASVIYPLIGLREVLPKAIATRAGQNFEEVSKAVGKQPVEMTANLNRSLTRIQQLAERGGPGSNLGPPAVRKFFLRITDPEKPPITYDEARDFYSNLSRLSRDELNKLTPVMQRAVGMFTRDLEETIQETARRGGKVEPYLKAMSGYNRAKNLEDALEKAWMGAKKASPFIAGGAAAGGTVELIRKLFE